MVRAVSGVSTKRSLGGQGQMKITVDSFKSNWKECVVRTYSGGLQVDCDDDRTKILRDFCCNIKRMGS